MADNPTMKTLTIDGVTYEIYDDVARKHIANIGVKTADMTQPVGIDENGKLWTVPSAGGLTEAQIAALDGMFKIAAYTEDASAAYAAFKTAFGIEDSGDVHTHSYTSAVTTAATCTTAGVRTYTCSCGESYTETIPATGHSYDEGVVTTPATCTEAGVKTFTCSKCGETYTEAIPATGHNYVDGVCTVCGATDPTYNPDVTLTSISAVYSGGDVTAGTAVNALTGIVVTAHYSDGTSEAVTGYTLSGTIAEGSNTITVSYEGKTTTFTVTGVAESGGEETGVSNETTWTNGVAYAFEPIANEYPDKASGAIKTYANWHRSPYLYCAGASTLRGVVKHESSIFSGTKDNAFYDADKNYVAPVGGASTFSFASLANAEVGTYVDIQIPENAAYFIISGGSGILTGGNKTNNEPYIEYVPYE